MANSHVQGLSLRTQVHVMTLGRTTAGINKGRMPAHRTANQLHRCVAASLSDDGGQLSRISWLDLPGDLVRPKFSNI